MVDLLTHEQRSAHMRKIRGKDTSPEISIRRWLHAQGYRFTIVGRDLPGKPDIVFRKRKKVIFVHGCFWHRHAGCFISHLPKTRTDYWEKKFKDNIKRDLENTDRLKALGWGVLVVWECETKSMDGLAEKIKLFLGPPRCLS